MGKITTSGPGGDRRLLPTADAAAYLGVPVRTQQANWRPWG